jgi:predicted Ser/Thr protein kinase
VVQKVGPVRSKPVLESIDLGVFLTTVAKAYAAGGTFAKQVTGAPDQGDQQDRDNLDSLCDSIEQQYSIALDRDASWKQAHEDVKKDLRSPAFQAKAWEKAREIQRIFGF